MIRGTDCNGSPCPFAITVFTPTKCIQTAYALSGQCTPLHICGGNYVNVSHLSCANGHIRFLHSAVILVARCCTSSSVDLSNAMRGPNGGTSTFVLHGIMGTVVKTPAYDCTPRALDSTVFSVDGWHRAVPVTAGVPILSTPGWVKTGAGLQKMFEVAYARAVALGAGGDYRDVLAVLLQSAAGPYTKQLGGDWRGCGYSAKCTNQDCDGMAMNVLVFFTALRKEASRWSFVNDGLNRTKTELLKYDTPVFITGESARPSDLVMSATTANARPVYVRPTKKWPIGHAWAGLAGPNSQFIHIECTTPGATTAAGGLDELIYRSRVDDAGGIKEIDGSHGAVSAVGVRQHHAACYNPWAAYTPTAMYTAHKGVHDVCGNDTVTSAIAAYYKKTFTRIATPTPALGNGAKYEHGAHRPNSDMQCSYDRPLGNYKETCLLQGEHGLNAFARYTCNPITVGHNTNATDQ